MPVFAQDDPRWSDLRLGPSTDTLGDEGCAVTSAAMVAAFYGIKTDPGQACAVGDGQWSSLQQRRRPDGDAETLQIFAEMVGALTKTREDIKGWFDLLGSCSQTSAFRSSS